MKPTQEQIDRRVVEARTQSSSSVLVAIADKVAELERAAETSRAEHAAALGLATARIRELESAFAELDALFPTVPAPPDDDTCEEDDSTCGKCGRLCTVDDGAEFERGDPCHPCAQESYAAARTIVARIEKATKGTT